MAKIDLLYGSIIGLIAGVFFYVSGSFLVEVEGLDSRVYPRVISGFTFLLSLLLIVGGLRGLFRESGSRQNPTALKSAVKRYYSVFKLFALGLVYVFVIEELGFILSTMLYVAAAMVLFGEKRPVRLIATAVSSAIVLYVVFRLVFRVPLPLFSVF